MKILSICLLLNLFKIVYSENIEYKKNDPNKITVDSSTSKDNQYTLTFKSSSDIPEYIKIILTPKEGQDTPILCYSPSDTTCLKDRRVLSSRVDKQSAIAFERKSEIESAGNKLNVLISCKEETCGYTLAFEGQKRCELDSDKGIVYSFVALKDNENFEFSAVGKSADDTYIHIGIEGSEEAMIRIDSNDAQDIKSLNYEVAKFTVYKTKNADGNINTISNFTIINGKKGDYIRLNVYSVHNLAKESNGFRAPDNLLYPGGDAVLGAIVPVGTEHPELCLPVSAFGNDEFKDTTDYYVTAKVYSKYGMFWLGDEYCSFQEETEVDIEDGLLAYLIHPYGKKSHICFEHFKPDDSLEAKDVLFSVQLVYRSSPKAGDIYYINPPMIVGQTYRYMVQKDKFSYYYGTKIDIANERYSFNIFNRKGVTEMYITSCDTFPNCTFDTNFEEEIPEGMELIRNTGKIAIYDRKIPKTIEALDQSKTIMLIKCVDVGNDNNGYCEFDASIFQKGQIISLIENENLAKYVVKGEEGSFKIDFKKGIKLLNVGVEIMIHSGEVLFDGAIDTQKNKLNDEQRITKYILSNKVFIDFNLQGENPDNLTVTFKALKNSFFTIKYISFNNTLLKSYTEEIIFAGESYLVNIDPISKEPLTLHLNNDRYKTKNPFLVNFFALNCDFKVMTTKLKETEISFVDGYAQDVIRSDEGKYYNDEYYKYTVSVEKEEQSNYNNKMCMLYVGAIQTYDKYYTTRIMIGNNVNQQIIFDDNFKNIRFLYPVPDTSRDIIIYANIIDKAYYRINVGVDSDENNIFRNSITRSTPIFLASAEYSQKCPPNTFCNIIIEMDLIRGIDGFPKTYHMIEITVREATNVNDEFTTRRVPTYIQKNIAKKDFTSGDGYYYVYTDIGRGDQGDITVNFVRDFGEVYGRIVRKGKVDDDYEKEWMDMYRLPGAEWEDDANYDRYLKKYHIKFEETADCIVGCYLILGIRISQIGEYALNWKFYQFSIITDISQYSSINKPITTIQVEEFIIGNIDISENENISQYYQVWLPRDAYLIHIDWQSELAGLYISIDEVNPTIKNAHFTLLPNGTDSIIVISKQEILTKAEEKGKVLPYENSIEDVRLVIGVWTDKTDAVDTELFSLRIHEVNSNYTDLDIYEVSTDQKVLCKPNYTKDGEYACLFMVLYDEQDVKQNMDLLVHTSSTNKGDTTTIYANFIYYNLYTQFNIDQLRGNIPNKNSQYNSIRSDTSYFYIKLNERLRDQYLFVNVITQTPDDIMLLASMNCYDDDDIISIKYYPNARTEQIAQVSSETLLLDFFTSSSLIVNIENLGGEADIRWQEDTDNVYHLRGKGDLLTLTNSNNYRYLLFKKLKSDKEQDGVEPGFVFIMNFYKRNSSINFDEVIYGNPIEFGYINTDLPLYLYSKTIDYNNDIHLAVTFKEFPLDTEGEFTKSPLDVRAYFDKRNNIYAVKKNPDFEFDENNKFDGIYDPAIKTAQVFLSNIDLNKKIILKPEDYPTLLLFIGKNKNYECLTYKSFNIEVQFSTTNSSIIPKENVYNYGKFSGMVPQYYKLRTDKIKKIMKIILSFNSNRLIWSISEQKGSLQNITGFNITKRNGKIIISLIPDNLDFVYINIFNSSLPDAPDIRIQNYVFRYTNVEKEEDFFEFEIFEDNSTLQYEKIKEDNIDKRTCTFYSIDALKNETNVTYFLKVADNNSYIPGERFSTIAVTESPYYTLYKKNPTVDNKMITMNVPEVCSDWCYIQVIAYIQQNDNLDYVAYDARFIANDELTCDKTQFLFNNKCFDCTECNETESDSCKCLSCKEGYYFENYQCKECSDHCKNCTNDATCNICDDGFLLEEGKCLSQCSNGYEKNGTECQRCNDDICKTFSVNKCDCIECKDNYYMGFNGCLQCDLNCKTCINTATICTSCYEGKFIYDDQCINCTECKETESDSCKCLSCNEGYYLENHQCKKCGNNCKECDNKGCNSCFGGYILNNKICIQCHDNCELCFAPSNGDTKQNCLSCKDNNTFLYEHNCLDNCSDGLYVDNKECKKCNGHCETCEKGEETNNENCLSCDMNSEYKYLIDANGFGKNCVKECPSGTILKESKCISKPSEEKSSNLVAIIVPSIIVPIIIIIVIIVLYRRHKKRLHLQVDTLIGKDKMELSKNFELE